MMRAQWLVMQEWTSVQAPPSEARSIEAEALIKIGLMLNIFNLIRIHLGKKKSSKNEEADLFKDLDKKESPFKKGLMDSFGRTSPVPSFIEDDHIIN